MSSQQGPVSLVINACEVLIGDRSASVVRQAPGP
jgi:hypothetical protein